MQIARNMGGFSPQPSKLLKYGCVPIFETIFWVWILFWAREVINYLASVCLLTMLRQKLARINHVPRRQEITALDSKSALVLIPYLGDNLSWPLDFKLEAYCQDSSDSNSNTEAKFTHIFSFEGLSAEGLATSPCQTIIHSFRKKKSF